MFQWQTHLDPKISAALDLIAKSEGTSTHPLTKNFGYDVIVTGIDGKRVFTDYRTHPFAIDAIPKLSPVQWKKTPPEYSTAAGRYQQIVGNWNVYRIQLSLYDYGPESQDKMCIQLLKEVRAVAPLTAGDIDIAIPLMAKRWASFAGSTAGQPTHSSEDLVSWYQDYLTSAAAGQIIA